MPTKKTKKTEANPEIGPLQFFTSPVKTAKDGSIAIVFPKNIVASVPFKDGVAHWIITNGVLQLSGNMPQAAIPPICDMDEFVPA